MRGLVALLLLTAAAAAAFAPTASAHYCSSSSSCGPCVEGEEHAHSDPSGSCVSYDREPRRGSASVGAGASSGDARADAKFVPGAGALGALVVLGVVALALERRRG